MQIYPTWLRNLGAREDTLHLTGFPWRNGTQFEGFKGEFLLLSLFLSPRWSEQGLPTPCCPQWPVVIGGAPLYPWRNTSPMLSFVFIGTCSGDGGGRVAQVETLPAAWCPLSSAEPWSCLLKLGSLWRGFSRGRIVFLTASQIYSSFNILPPLKVVIQNSRWFHSSLWLRILLCVNLEAMWLVFSTSLNRVYYLVAVLLDFHRLLHLHLNHKSELCCITVKPTSVP